MNRLLKKLWKSGSEFFTYCHSFRLRGPWVWGQWRRARTGTNVIKIWVDGRPVHLRRGTTDRNGFFEIFGKKSYHPIQLRRFPELQSHYESILKSGRVPIILDCGANIGMAAIFLSQLYPEARILCVEPDRENFELLKRNCGSQPEFHLVHGAIWPESSPLSLVNLDMGKDAVRVEAAAKNSAETVKGYTVGELLRQVEGEPLLMKIDIEGTETKLFETRTEWLDDFPLIVIELHDWLLEGEASSQNFLKAISAFSRDFVLGDQVVFSIRNPIRRKPVEGKLPSTVNQK